MGIDWNDDFPGLLGVEHIDAGYKHQVIDTPSIIAALGFRSRRTGSVAEVEFYAGAGSVAPPLSELYNELERPMICDIVPAGSEPYTISSTTYAVTAVTGVGAVINEDFSTPITVSRLTTPGDSLFVAAGSLNAGFRAQFGTGAFPLDRHVLSVVVGLKINLNTRLRKCDPGLSCLDSPWFHDIPAFANPTQLTETTLGETKVDGTDTAWSHWTPQDIRDFASGGTRAIQATCRAGPGYWRVDYAFLKVFWTPERRVGLGIGTPNEPQAWTTFDLTTPAATGAPALVSGADYTLLLRRITDYSVHTVAPFTVMPWRALRGRDQEGLWRQHSVAFNPFLGITSFGPQIDGIPCARFVNAGAVVADAQPYDLQRGALVYGAQALEQDVSVAGAALTETYGQVLATVGWPSGQARPNGPLRAEVTRVSDGVRVFSPVQVTADDVARLPFTAPSSHQDDQGTVYRTVRMRFPESQTLAAGQYRIAFESPDTSESRAWRVALLIAEHHSIDQTFGGSTDRAYGVFLLDGDEVQINDVGVRTCDAQVALMTVPPAVTGVGTAVGSLTVHHAELCDGPDCGGDCADDTLPYTVLTWSAAPSGTPDVVAYEIDRFDTLAPDWERVADVAGRTSTSWADHEVRIGVQSRYRVRVRRADEVTGDWSDEATITIPTGQIALAMSSNAATGMGCVFPEVWTTREVTRNFQFLEAGDVSLAPMYGRQRQVAFRPLERKGISFTRTVLLNALCSVEIPTMSIFDPLRDLAWAPVPYVCVRDGEGNRWYATLIVPEGDNVRPGERWFAELRVVEVADVPTVHDTSVAQVTEVPRL